MKRSAIMVCLALAFTGILACNLSPANTAGHQDTQPAAHPRSVSQGLSSQPSTPLPAPDSPFGGEWSAGIRRVN